MLQFSPINSRVWQKASFSLVYSSIVLVAIRSGLFLILVFTLFLLLTEVNKLSYLVFFVLGNFIMFELFYRFKIGSTVPTSSVNEVTESSNLADVVDFQLAKLLLAHPNWDTTLSLLKTLVKDPKVTFFLYKSDIQKEDLAKLPAIDEKQNMGELLELARSFSERDRCLYIDSLSLIAALFSSSPILQKLAFDKRLKTQDLENILHWGREVFEKSYNKIPFWEKGVARVGLGFGSLWMGGWTLETERYTKEIDWQTNEQILVGRESEVAQVEQVLMRTSKRNAILLGEPGIGKSAIVYSLAAKSFLGQLPAGLLYKRFLELDVTAINASAGEGEIEERLKNILIEVSHAGDVVLFIPEIENLAGALEGGKFDISGLLNQNIHDINLQIIGTASRSSYHRFIEQKPAFAENFEIIDVPEPEENQAIQILEEASSLIEKKTLVIISYNAIKKAVELSERYMIDKVLPGKAIDLLDEASSAISLEGRKLLEEGDVEKLVTTKAKVPVNLAQGKEKDQLIKLEETLHQRVVGQDEALVALSQAVRRSRTLKRDSKKPIGVFLFLGPTGVGKTETAKALAEVYYGSENRIIRMDMSEFNQETSVYRLIGAPPGMSEYKEGGQLTEAVRSNPFSLVLLDELEKAHPKVEEVFLAIFDEGRITDSSGRPISFTNSIIIATSNAGAEFIREEINKQTPLEELKKNLIEKLLEEGTFKPEFINRFDEVIVYKPLDQEQVKKVVEFMLANLTNRLSKQDLTLSFSPEVVSFLAQTGYDPQFGARPLQRAIANQVESKISEALLEGKLDRGSKANLSLVNNQISIS